ncbi:hypothetical protein LQ567_00040 [Niabella pedocola]|uniref:YcxB-like protein domain-containing protein n=1 Tax=Niabella pedocola TaxID=1752077 RepID=A0ABS8PJ52_9BACT|nr:hypothetical protein [Niabella pedocola]MCD2421132.1 hypothetical protein [Niabella pedocola]
MDTLIISEKKKKYKVDLIVVAVIFVPTLYWIISSSVAIGFAIFLIIVLLIIPGFIVAGYIWDVAAKITLSKEGIAFSYGRNIYDIVNFEAGFGIEPDSEFIWKNISDFYVLSLSSQSSGGSDGVLVTSTNNYLTVLYRKDGDLPKHWRKGIIRLRRFEKEPAEILALCKAFKNKFGTLQAE